MIWFLRHGDAADEPEGGGGDPARKLTPTGEKQSKWAGKALAALRVEFDACLTSPKLRALDTAKIVCQSLGIEPEIDQGLRGGGFDPLELAAGRGEVLLVGHEPDFSDAIGDLTGARMKLKKGGLAAVEDRELHLLLRPADLKRIAKDS